MKTSSLKQSKYLTKDDAGEGILVTMHKLTEENVEQEGKPERMKWILHFHEADRKPLVLNTTNIALIEKCYGDETDDWMGRHLVLFNDENVSFGGEITGGVRVSVSRTKGYNAKNPPKPKVPLTEKPASHFDDMVDDVPF